MSKRCSLETQTKKVNMVIDLPFKNSIDSICEELKKCGYLYAMILHDKDVDKNGVLKVPHYHLILSSPKRHRLKYYLDHVSDIFNKVNKIGCPTTDGVEVMTSESLEWDLQYLIHKNDKDKYQYSKDSIITNINDVNLTEMLSIEVQKQFTVNDVLEVIYNSKDELEVAAKIGIGNFNLYSKLISLAVKNGALGINLVHED